MKRYVILEDMTVALSMWRAKGIVDGCEIVQYKNLDDFLESESKRVDLLYKSKVLVDVGMLKDKGVHFIQDHFPGLKYYLHSGGIFRVQDFPGAIGIVEKCSFNLRDTTEGICGI